MLNGRKLGESWEKAGRKLGEMTNMGMRNMGMRNMGIMGLPGLRLGECIRVCSKKCVKGKI
jgi:hypothetical protein